MEIYVNPSKTQPTTPLERGFEKYFESGVRASPLSKNISKPRFGIVLVTHSTFPSSLPQPQALPLRPTNTPSDATPTAPKPSKPRFRKIFRNLALAAFRPSPPIVPPYHTLRDPIPHTFPFTPVASSPSPRTIPLDLQTSVSKYISKPVEGEHYKC